MSILYRSKITLYWNPRKSGMYYEFSKNDILLMQQLKVLVASSIDLKQYYEMRDFLGF